MQGLLADSKHAFRIYRRTPLASLIAVGVLAIGMAFVGSFVSLYVDLILRPHPGIEDNRRIVSIEINPGAIRLGLLELIAEEATSLEAVAGVNSTVIATGPEREARYVDLVTRDFFSGFRPRLALGRGFENSDHTADSAPVVVISDDYWRDQFDRDPDVIGRVIEIHQRGESTMIRTVDGRPEISQQEQDGQEPTGFQIVGVMSPAMKGLWSSNVELWLPLERAASLIFSPERIEESRPYMAVSIVGRHIRGASAAAVANELESRYSDINDFFVRMPSRESFRISAVIAMPVVSCSCFSREVCCWLSSLLQTSACSCLHVHLAGVANSPSGWPSARPSLDSRGNSRANLAFWSWSPPDSA
jgi:hypothetical protein